MKLLIFAGLLFWIAVWLAFNPNDSKSKDNGWQPAPCVRESKAYSEIPCGSSH